MTLFLRLLSLVAVVVVFTLCVETRSFPAYNVPHVLRKLPARMTSPRSRRYYRRENHVRNPTGFTQLFMPSIVLNKPLNGRPTYYRRHEYRHMYPYQRNPGYRSYPSRTYTGQFYRQTNMGSFPRYQRRPGVQVARTVSCPWSGATTSQVDLMLETVVREYQEGVRIPYTLKAVQRASVKFCKKCGPRGCVPARHEINMTYSLAPSDGCDWKSKCACKPLENGTAVKCKAGGTINYGKRNFTKLFITCGGKVLVDEVEDVEVTAQPNPEVDEPNPEVDEPNLVHEGAEDKTDKANKENQATEGNGKIEEEYISEETKTADVSSREDNDENTSDLDTMNEEENGSSDNDVDIIHIPNMVILKLHPLENNENQPAPLHVPSY